MRTIALFGLLLLLGSGCTPKVPGTEAVPGTSDATPGVNEENCLRSGGRIAAGACGCPEGYAPDPAGFCLDASGTPGGAMKPVPTP